MGASSNAVNLTDGLDGLAIMPVVMVLAGLGVFAYVTGNAVFSRTCSSRAFRRRRAADLLRGHGGRGWPSCGSTRTRRGLHG